MQRKIRLLIVEDEEAIRAGLIDVFVYHGYDVDFAADGPGGRISLGGADVSLHSVDRTRPLECPDC